LLRSVARSDASQDGKRSKPAARPGPAGLAFRSRMSLAQTPYFLPLFGDKPQPDRSCLVAVSIVYKPCQSTRAVFPMTCLAMKWRGISRRFGKNRRTKVLTTVNSVPPPPCCYGAQCRFEWRVACDMAKPPTGKAPRAPSPPRGRLTPRASDAGLGLVGLGLIRRGFRLRGQGQHLHSIPHPQVLNDGLAVEALAA
jgi:hypothetical protein